MSVACCDAVGGKDRFTRSERAATRSDTTSGDPPRSQSASLLARGQDHCQRRRYATRVACRTRCDQHEDSVGRGCSTSLNRRMRTRSTVVWGGSSARMTLTRLFVVAPVHFDGCRVGALNGRSFSGTLPNHVEYRSSYSTDQRTPKALNAASSCELEIGEVNSEKAIIPKNMQGIIGPQCWRAAITLSDTRTSPAIIPDQVVGGAVRGT